MAVDEMRGWRYGGTEAEQRLLVGAHPAAGYTYPKEGTPLSLKEGSLSLHRFVCLSPHNCMGVYAGSLVSCACGGGRSCSLLCENNMTKQL